MLAFLACVFYALYCVCFVLCVVFAALVLDPNRMMGIAFLMEKELEKVGSDYFQRVLIPTVGIATLIAKLLYLICWHYA